MSFPLESFAGSWVDNHPFLNWLILHPFVTIVLVLFSLIMLMRLLSVLVHLLDKLWISLLQTPVNFVKSLFGIDHSPLAQSSLVNQNLALNKENFSLILQQLEQINHQQEQIITELSTLKQLNALKQK